MYFNQTEAESFLRALDPVAKTWTFQVIDVAGGSGEAKVLPGPLEKIGPQLKQYNKQGLDVYVTVNETDGRGRKKPNMRRARAVWQEDDGDGKQLPLKPHIEVQSSEGHAHRYLLVNGDVSLDAAEGFNQRIAQDFGGDPGAVDYTRVLRVPGFYNHKRKCPVRLVSASNDPPYHLEDLRRALGEPVVKKRVKDYGPLPVADNDGPDDWLFQLPSEIARYLTGEEMVDGEKDDFKIIKELYRIHPDAEWAWDILTTNATRSKHPEKYQAQRADYKHRTLHKAWAEIQAEKDVFEVEESVEPIPPAQPPLAFDIKLPGVAGELAEWIMHSSMQQVPSFAVASALSTIAALTAGGFVVERTLTPLNVYFFIVGETGFGKDAYLRAAYNVLRKIPGADQRVTAMENASSGQALMRRMSKRNRALLLMVDEVGHFIGAAKSRDNFHGQGLMAQIMSLYSQGASTYAGRGYADSKQDIEPIDAPFLQFIGATTPAKLWAVTTQAQIDEGWVNRLLIMYADGAVENDTRRLDLPAGLRDKLARVYNASIFPDSEMPAMHVGEQQLAVWPIEDKAHRYWAKKRDEVKGLGALWSRAPEHTLRVAGLIALADQRPIAVSDMEVAWRLVDWSFRRTVQGAGLEMASETPFGNLCRRILRLVKEGKTEDKKYQHLCRPGRVPLGYVRYMIFKHEPIPQRQFDDAIQALVNPDGGQLRGVKVKGANGKEVLYLEG